MARTLTEGEWDVLRELNHDADEPGEWDWVEACRGCGCPVYDCDCKTIEQQREERDNSLLASDDYQRTGRAGLWGAEPW